MKNLTAICSLLHQGPQVTSATRRFRGEPVLTWTLRRLALAGQLSHRAILCWEDQFAALKPIAEAAGAFVLAKGPRCSLPGVEAVAASRRWCDGWRGGLLGATCFDLGFHGPWISEIQQRLNAEAIVLVDPDAGLVDPALIDALVSHAQRHPNAEYCFLPAAPGLGGALIRAKLLQVLAAKQGYLGQLLNYWPDAPSRDPLAKEECAPVPTPVARTLHRFTLNSERQIARIDRYTQAFNGTLLKTESERLVAQAAQHAPIDPLPREIVLELTTRRATQPIYWPGRHLPIQRPDLTLPTAQRLFEELSAIDEVRLTLAGVGDPMLCPDLFKIIEAAHAAGIAAIHLQSDLVDLQPQQIQQLAELPLDVLSVNLPAASSPVYASLMGLDALEQVVENMRQFLLHRQSRARLVPILLPTFIKCRQNLQEMEAWYDHWLRTIGCALIVSPTDCAGQIPDLAAADMAPPRRLTCRRLESRLSILSDGRAVACEEDVTARQVVGQIGQQPLQTIWQTGLGALRARPWDQSPLCPTCRQWHRP